MAVSNIVIKVKYGNTFRRFSAMVYDDVRLEYLMEGLRRKILGLFHLSPDSDLTLKYTDEDGDLVTLVDDEELQDVVKQRLNPFMIYVTLNNNNKSSGNLPRQQLTDCIAEVLNSLPRPFYEVITKTTLDDANVSSFAYFLGKFAESFSKMGVSKQNGNTCEDDSKQNSGQSEDDSEQYSGQSEDDSELNSCQSEDDSEQNNGQSEDDSEQNNGQAEDDSEQNSGQSEDDSEQNSGQSEDYPEQNSEQSEDASEQNIGQSEDDSEQNSGQSEDDSEQNGDELNDSYECAASVDLNQEIPNKNISHRNGIDNINKRLSEIKRFHDYISYTPTISTSAIAPATHPYTKPIKKLNQYSGGVVHRGVQCFRCECHPISGSRFKNKINENFNLCSMCFSKMGNYSDYIRIDCPTFLHRPDAIWQSLKLDSRFISDGNVFDGCVLAPSTSFIKIWRMRNSGTLAWPRGTMLVWTGGLKMSAVLVDLKVPICGVRIEREYDISVEFVTPKEPGKYISYWRMASPSGELFGEQVRNVIHVGFIMNEPYVRDIALRQLEFERMMNHYNMKHSVDEGHKWEPLLKELNQMGFYDREKNIELLDKYNGDVDRSVVDLVKQLLGRG